jgi:hypothetical protein
MQNARAWIFQLFQANYQTELKNIDVQGKDEKSEFPSRISFGSCIILMPQLSSYFEE